ncbi:MAG TPA: alanine racemase [Roseiflexaceae bacterium]|nr:alanine racemase [Roseiflexaceae bacterium]
MTTLAELETPVAIVDLDRLASNIIKLQHYLDEHRIANWPHIKTHKIPEIAHMQLAAGAAGITSQKLGEAAVMVQAGIRHIFMPYNLIGEAKLNRLMRLLHRAHIRVTADSAVVVDGLAAAVAASHQQLTVLVECDTGGQRCGVQTPHEAAALARRIAAAPGLHFGGLMTYPIDERLDPFVAEVRTLLAADGIGIDQVTAGSTARMWQAHQHREVTEYRAGMYIYGDRATVARGAMTLEECSFHVIATVVSRPTATRGILDAGSKVLSSDTLGQDGHGLILEYPEARIYGLSEEHGHTDFSACDRVPAIGERVTILPNHCCVVTNLFNQIVGVRNGSVELVWPVAARGLVT